MKNKLVLGLPIAIIVAFIGIAVAISSGNNQTQNTNSNQKDSDVTVQESTNTRTNETVTDTLSGDNNTSNDITELSESNYQDYSDAKLSFANSGDVILFFKANWCPSCNAVDASITSNLDSIPDDVLILKIDYDTATELKNKYNIRTQHTFVQVDSNGNELGKWIGGNTLSDVLDYLN